MRKVTPEKLSWRAMYMPLTFMSMATISMAPTPLQTDKAAEHGAPAGENQEAQLRHMPCGQSGAWQRDGEEGTHSHPHRLNASPPLLNGVKELLEGPEGCAVAPDAQAAHVDHVARLRGT